jgi:hypothetical protein
MRGDTRRGRVLVSIEIDAQSGAKTAYYVCREDEYAADLLAAMKDVTQREDNIRKMTTRRLGEYVIFASELKP